MSDSARRNVDESLEGDPWSLRLTVTPEPTDEELIAILEVLRTRMMAPPNISGRGDARSGWELAARREMLRSTVWTVQFECWESG
jgi:hypothetical protein